MSLKHLIHTEIEKKFQLLQDLLRKHGKDALESVSEVTIGTQKPTIPVETTDISQENEGFDLTTWDDIDDLRLYVDYFERVVSFDTFANSLISKFRSTAGLSGHTHNGEDGQGPNIPSENIPCPVDTIGGDSSVREHVLNEDIHGELIDPEDDTPNAFYDNFEQDDLTTWWEVVAGSPSVITEADGTFALDIPQGAKIRLKNAISAWVDGFTIDYDLWVDSSPSPDTCLLHVRTDIDDTCEHLVFKYDQGTSGTCGIYTNPTPQTIVETITNYIGSAYRHIRNSIYGSSFVQWVDIDNTIESAITRQAGVYSGPINPLQGYIEFEGGGHIRVKNFCIVHTRNIDARNFRDGLYRFTSSAGITGNHASSHQLSGNDILDVDNLADEDELLLSGVEKGKLFTRPDADNLHEHTSQAVTLSDTNKSGTPGYPAVGNDTTLNAHLKNATIHGMQGMSHSIPTKPLQPHPGATIGQESSAARRDHTHVCPCWYVEREIVYRPEDSDDTLTTWAKPAHFTSAGGPMTYTHKRIHEVHPTIYGEYLETMLPGGYSYSPFTTNNPQRAGEEYQRLRLPLYNGASTNVEIGFYVVTADKSVWFTVWNESGEYFKNPNTMLSGMYDERQWFKVTRLWLRPGWNDVIVYVCKFWGCGRNLAEEFGSAVNLYPIDLDKWANGSGYIYPASIFQYAWHYDETTQLNVIDTDIRFRTSVANSANTSPAFLSPDAYISEVR